MMKSIKSSNSFNKIISFSKMFYKDRLHYSQIGKELENHREMILKNRGQIIEYNVTREKKIGSIYYQDLIKKYLDADMNNSELGEGVFRLKKSNLLKLDQYKDPMTYTIKYPETEEEYKNKFKKNPKISNKVTLNTDHIDDYYVIGAEIFRNIYKDQILQGNTKLEIGYDDYHIGAYEAMKIRENRFHQEDVYFPIKNEFKINVKEKEINPNPYYYSVSEDMTHIYQPSEKEPLGFINPIKGLKGEFTNRDRDQHNQEIYEKFGKVCDLFNWNFPLFNSELDSIISDLKQIKKKDDMLFSSEAISRCIKFNDFTEIKDSISPDDVFKFKANYEKLLNIDVDFKLCCNLISKLFYELNLNIKQLAAKYEQVLLENFHHLQFDDLCRIYYITSLVSPKYYNRLRSEIMNEITKNKLENYSSQQIIKILLCFRHSKLPYLYESICEIINKNLKNWLKDSIIVNQNNKKSNVNNQPKQTQTPENLLLNMLFALSYGKPTTNKKYYLDLKEEVYQIVSNNIDEILTLIPNLNMNQIILLLDVISKSSVDDAVDLIIHQLEKPILKAINQKSLTQNNIAEIIRYINLIKNCKSSGSDEFIVKLLQYSLTFDLNKYSNDQFVEILYLSSYRRLNFDKNNNFSESKDKVMKEIWNKLDIHLKKVSTTLRSYKQLSLVFYHIMFQRINDKELFNNLFSSCNAIIGNLTIKHYKAFKFFDLYLRDFCGYSYSDCKDLRDRFYYAEQHLNIAKNEPYYAREIKYTKLKETLNREFGIPFRLCFAYDNMFMIPLFSETRKIAFFLYLDKDYLPNSKKLNPKSILEVDFFKKKQDWEVLFLTWDDYINLGNDKNNQRDEKLFYLLEELTLKQEKKGILNRNARYL